MKILVFDIGGTAIKHGCWIDGALVEVHETPTEAKKGGRHIVNTLIALIEAQSGYDAIGISTAGQVNADGGYIIYANENIPGYMGTQIKAELEERFHVPVAVENDVNAAALVRMAMDYDPALDNGRKIFARLDDPNVMQILDRWVDEIMLGLSTLTHVFNPACIVLGGGIMVQPLILEKIRQKKERFIMPSFAHVDIRPAKLGNTAGLLGACYLAAQYAQM